jgi:hypothetical protein
MYRFMRLTPGSFVESVEEGMAKVKAGGYAFILESTTLKYMLKNDCDLIQLGDLFDDKGYGIAAPNSSPWIPLITNAILKMKTYGELAILYEKYWLSKNKITDCDISNEKHEDASTLGLAKLGGVFLIVGFFLFLSCIISLLEYSWVIMKNSKNKV